MLLNTNYNYTVTVSPPDGLSTVASAIVTFKVLITPTVTFNLTVNGQSCNTPLYVAHTTYADAGQVEITFDCSNVIKYKGAYNLVLRPTQANTGAITGWLDISYTNAPKGEATVHGTEYEAGQDGKLWLQLVNSTGGDISNGLCYIDIYTPDNEEYLERAQMNNLHHDGIYYYDLVVPEIEGVYPAIAKCYYEATTVPNYATNYQLVSGTVIDGTLSKTYTIDGLYASFREDGSPNQVDLRLNFTNISSSCLTTPETLFTGITVSIYGEFDSVVSDDITMYIYNFSSNSWYALPNKLLEGAGYRSASNSVSFTNLTKSGFYNSTRGIILKFNDTGLPDTIKSYLDIDQVYVSCDQLASPGWQEVKGSSEMHVNPPTTGLGNKFFVYTLCGDENTESDSSGCMEFRFGNYTSAFFTEGFEEPQGWLYENITIVNSRQRDIDTYFVYETPMGVDCTAFLDITRSVDGGAQEDFYDNVSVEVGSVSDNCRVTFPVVMSSEQNDIHFTLIADNYMLWEANRANRLVSFYRQPIEALCTDFAAVADVNLTVPITTNLSEYSSNTILTGCWQSIDDLYWFDDYYNNGLLENTSGDYSSALVGVRFYYPSIIDHFNTVESLLTNTIPLFMVETLCEKISGVDLPNDDDFSCQILKDPDDYFSSQEGWILANITFTNTYQSHILSTFDFQTGQDVDCSAILDVIRVDENGNEVDIYDDIITRSGDKSNCIVTLPIHFDANETSFDILVKQENYIHWNMFQMKDKIYAIRNNTETFCYDLLSNVSWYVPINDSIDDDGYTADQRFCLRAIDDLYWFDFFDAGHEATHNDTHYLWQLVSYYDEFLYYYPFIMYDDSVIKAYQRSANQELTLSLLQSVGATVWNHSTRNLTYYEDTTNYTRIDSTIYLVNQSLSADISSVPFYAWGYANRSLTDDPTNYTKIDNLVLDWFDIYMGTKMTSIG